MSVSINSWQSVRLASASDTVISRAYLNQVHLVESLVVTGSLDIQNGDNVLVVKVAQQLHLAQRPQAEHGVVKGCDLFDGDLLTRRLVNRGAVF